MTQPTALPSFATRSRRGFTLIEVLITISLIILVLALALPAFNFLTGGRSVEGAQNQVSAFLGRARADAIGVQKITGVMFFIEPKTRNVSCAFVRETERPTNQAIGTFSRQVAPAASDFDNPNVQVYLDLLPDRDVMSLPAGVLAMTIDNGGVNTAVTPNLHTTDGYIGFNGSNTPSLPVGGTNAAAPRTVREYGGVILFDGNGQLVSRTYAFRTRRPNADKTAFVSTALGRLLYGRTIVDPSGDAQSNSLGAVLPTGNLTRLTASQFGVMLFDRGLFEARNYTLEDPQMADPAANTATAYAATTGGRPSEASEENEFIDKNATAVLINRYNGTLIRAD